MIEINCDDINCRLVLGYLQRLLLAVQIHISSSLLCTHIYYLEGMCEVTVKVLGRIEWP